MGNDMIIIKNLNQYYGKKQALNDINLEIKNGMFGLLGRNGAGKTTLMRTITTLLPVSSGDITVCGVPITRKEEVRSIIGYLPQDFSMYGNMTVYEAMDYLGVLSGLHKKERKKRIPEFLERVNLQNNMGIKVKTMSGGMKRRLGIAQAILHNPKVIIVDEPTAGLDPEERVKFRNLLSEIAEERIVILSTHIVGDIEATCENVAILNEGSVLYQGTVCNLIQNAEDKIYTATVAKIELEHIKNEFVITSMMTMPSEVNVRFIAEKGCTLPKGAVPCKSNVEDAYMCLMYEKEGVK